MFAFNNATRVVAAVTVALLGVLLSLPANAADLTTPRQTERRVLGQSISQPLAANADPEVTQTLTELRSKVRTHGTVRVIVGVRAPFAPEGNLSAAQAQVQRDDIATAQRRIHARLPRQAANAVTHFELIPFSVFDVDAGELETLASTIDVTQLQEDRLSAPMLGESVPLIRANAAWTAGYTGSGWSVAVLDSGVDKTHPFLTGAVISEACYSSNNAISGATSVCPGGVTSSTATGSGVNCPISIEGCKHGTHVAGISAGVNASMAGVAKGANIIAIQVFSRFTSTTTCGSVSPCALSYDSDQILALQRVYALRNTFKIAAVNMSLGGRRYTTQAACDSDGGAEKAAIDLLRSAGIATVISAGNDGYTDSTGWPACISSAVSVGATYDSTGWNNICSVWNGGPSSVDEVACYSNSATFLDLLAPGSVILSSVPGGTYQNLQGTSMAAPHVAGCWAILKQAKPAASVDQIELALKTTGVPVQDWRTGLTKPRIDCRAALDNLLAGGGNPPNLAISSFVVSPTTVVVGGPVAMTVSVKNVGAGTSAATALRYFELLNSSWSEITSCRTAIGSVAAGATSNHVCNSVAPSVPTTKSFHVAVDAVAGEVSTTDNTSNTVSLTVTTAPIPSYLLTVTKSGTGTGTVMATGINCGTDCSQLFSSGTSVTLTATPAAGMAFTGWSGACTGGSCLLLMNGPKSVTANFAPIPPNLTIASFHSTSSTVMAGGSIILSTTVRNIGAGGSSATTLRFFEWTGSAWSEMAFCRASVSALTPGATSPQYCTIIPPSGPNDYSYYVAVDAVSGETVTTDNLADYLTVTVTPDTTSATATGLITSYYQTILGRAPDAGGLAFWQSEVTRLRGLGVNINEGFYAMALAFFNSTEYTGRNTSDTQFLTDLYRTFFLREPDAGGMTFWRGQLSAGVPRLAVLNSFIFSTEFKSFMTNAFGAASTSPGRAEVSVVIDFYRGVLGRLPDSAGFNAWLVPFRAAQCQGAATLNAQVDAISQQFIASGEYAGRTPSRFTVAGAPLYVSDLYNAFLKRPVDAAGLQNWATQVATGSQTRDQVRKAFVASAEFQGKVAALIAQGCLQ